jgi:hypothetical protein
MLLLGLALGLLTAGPARAAQAPPVEPPHEAPATDPITKKSAPQGPALPWFGGLALGAQAGYLPALFLADAFTEARAVGYYGGALELFGPLGRNWNWVLAGGLFRLLENDGFWQAKGTPRDGAFYARPRSNLLTATAGLEWQRPLVGPLTLALGGDLGLAWFTGDIRTSEIIPGCDGPIGTCGHWQTQGTEGIGLPGSILPLLGVHGGLRLPLPRGLFVQWDLGWRDLPYTALKLGFRRP